MKWDEKFKVKDSIYRVMNIDKYDCILNRKFGESSMTISFKYDKKYNIPEGTIEVKYVSENEIEISIDNVVIDGVMYEGETNAN